MQLRARLGIEMIVAGLGVALLGWGCDKGSEQAQLAQPTPSPVDEEKSEPAGSAVTESESSEPTPGITIAPPTTAPAAEPTDDTTTVTLASPPPIDMQGDAERSFRASADPTAATETPVAPERTGLSEAISSITPSTPPAVAPIDPAPIDPAPIDPVEPEPVAPPAIDNPPVPEIDAVVEAPKPGAKVDTKEADSKPAGIIHVIQPGDSYSALAVRYYGSERYTNLIIKANPGKDPRRLLVGTKINIPPAPEAAKPQASAAASASEGSAGPVPSSAAPKSAALPPIPEDRLYIVKPGESWRSLAARFLGNEARWPELYELNKDRVGGARPEALRANTKIELPEGVSTRPARN